MIRIGERKDLPEIVSIYNASIPERMATADINDVTVESRIPWFLEHQNQRPLWVYEKDNEITGWLSLQNFYGRPAYQATVEVSLYTNPLFKRQSVASSLLSHALNECAALGIRTVVGFIFGHNIPSIKLFQNFGFEQWGYLPKVAELDGIEKDLAIYGLKIKESN